MSKFEAAMLGLMAFFLLLLIYGSGRPDASR